MCEFAFDRNVAHGQNLINSLGPKPIMKSDSPGANTEKANVYNPTNRYDDLFPVRIPLELDKNPSIKDMQTLQQENSDMAIKRA